MGEFRRIGPERVLLHTNDEKARDLIAERGTIVCFSHWNAEMQILDKK